VTDHLRFLLRLHLRHIDALDTAIREIDQEVGAVLVRIDETIETAHARLWRLIGLLTKIPGISVLAARTIIAEIGWDMSRFATAAHLLSWAGLRPRNDESAGKRRSSRLRKGNPWLKSLLVQCAWAASRAKDSYFRGQFHRLRVRRGPKKAICAVAASILTTVYHMFKDGTDMPISAPTTSTGGPTPSRPTAS
jgi:transposase